MHNTLVAFDMWCAAVFFNVDDVTVSSLCGLARRGPLPTQLKFAAWQVKALGLIGAGLEFFWPGHCEEAIASDIARGSSAAALLTRSP